MSTPSRSRIVPLQNTANNKPLHGRKRKASELNEHDSANHQKAIPNAPQAKQKEVVKTPRQVTVDDVPFTIQCPPGKRKSQTEDVFEAVQEGDVHHLPNISYAIRPGSKWESIKSYKHCKLAEQTFTRGDIVYINHTFPVPSPLWSTATDEEKLNYDKENLWVGRIMECRATDEAHVYLRLMWLYWPDELPMGRQPYHGIRELVASNAVDIVDAQSIASRADVSYWDEDDDEADTILGEPYWRQTFDVNVYEKWKLKGKPGGKVPKGLSELKKHCVCGTEHDPDLIMYKCNKKTCGCWNHSECLIDAILEDVYGKSLRGELEKEQQRPVMASTSTPSGVRGMINTFVRQVMSPSPERDTEAKTYTKRAKPNNKPRPWDGRFSCVLNEPTAASESIVAELKDLRTTKKTKGAGDKAGIQWEKNVTCLRCGTVMT